MYNPTDPPATHVIPASSLKTVVPPSGAPAKLTLLVLCGLPGSGKSTIAAALTSHATQRWVRASQDDAPNRRRQECEAMVRQGLKEECNVVVDRVGFDKS
jgi:adenylylsulfate kinase-like enzyme